MFISFLHFHSLLPNSISIRIFQVLFYYNIKIQRVLRRKKYNNPNNFKHHKIKELDNNYKRCFILNILDLLKSFCNFFLDLIFYNKLCVNIGICK